jgi:phage FluMu protein Com
MGDKTLKLVSALSGQKIEMKCPKLKESRRNSQSE